MKKGCIYALVKTNTGKCVFKKFMGELMKFGKFNCGLYQTYRTDPQAKNTNKLFKVWYVVELTSGVAIASAPTKKECVSNARQKVKYVAAEMIMRIIERHINEFGQSPLYQEGLDID